MNEEITFPNVLLVYDDGTTSKLPLNAAIHIAGNKGLDLVCISPNAPFPVCKIMDYGKFLYEQKRKQRESRKNQTTIETGEVQISLAIELNDMKTKASAVKRIIERGDFVRVVLRLRKKEQRLLTTQSEEFKKIIYDKLNQFSELCSEFASIKKDIFNEGFDFKLLLEKKKD